MTKHDEAAIRARAAEVARQALQVHSGQSPLEDLETAFDDLHRAVVNLGGGRVWTRDHTIAAAAIEPGELAR